MIKSTVLMKLLFLFHKSIFHDDDNNDGDIDGDVVVVMIIIALAIAAALRFLST